MITIIRFKHQYKEFFEKVCSDIYKKDKTFIYRIEENKIIIENPDKNTAIRRKKWFYAVPDFRNKIIYTMVKNDI